MSVTRKRRSGHWGLFCVQNLEKQFAGRRELTFPEQQKAQAMSPVRWLGVVVVMFLHCDFESETISLSGLLVCITHWDSIAGKLEGAGEAVGTEIKVCLNGVPWRNRLWKLTA